MLSVITTLKLQLPVLPAASCAKYVIVVVPLLNKYVPTALIPVRGEEAMVAPDIVQVSCVTEQLSEYVGATVLKFAAHNPGETFAV